MSNNGDQSKRYTISGIYDKEVVDIAAYECPHCGEIVPDMGTCSQCHTQYVHKESKDNFLNNTTTYKFECTGCDPKNQVETTFIPSFASVGDRRDKSKSIEDLLLEKTTKTFL